MHIPNNFKPNRLASMAKVFTISVAALAGLMLLAGPQSAEAQGFPNVTRTPGELLSGPIAPEQGRTAIVAWHGERIVSVPEPPGSQPGADVEIRIVDINDPYNPVVTHVPDGSGGFNSHGYFKTGPYLYTGTTCLTPNLLECTSSNDHEYRDAFLIDVAGTTGRQKFQNSDLVRASIQGDAGVPFQDYNRSAAQTPWSARMWWSYGEIDGLAYVARKPTTNWIPRENNMPGEGHVQAVWDHLGETGVIGMPFIMGNILIYASDQTGTGVATYDISDPTNPVLLDVLKQENPGGYWPEVYGSYIFFPRRNNEGGPGSQAGYMIVDFSDPTDLRVVANKNTPGSNQYVTFQDEYAFMNSYKIDMRTFEPVLELDMTVREGETPPVMLDASQFALPVGNLVITGGYGTDGPGLAVWAHQAEPDTRPPFVAYHVPVNDQANYSIYCPITISIPETLKSETIIDGDTLIVRPVGGDPIATWHSFGQNKLLTITPQEYLQENTTYEVVLEDIEDAMGNAMETYTFRFSTGSTVSGGNTPPEILSLTSNPAVGQPGQQLTLNWTGIDAEDVNLEYRIDFGDGSDKTPWANSTSAMHTYTDAGHYQVTAQVRDSAGSISAFSKTITVANQPLAPNSTASSKIINDGDSDRIFIVNSDNNTVTAISTGTDTVLWEVSVGKDPRSIAQSSNGNLWVACKDSDTVDIISSVDGQNISTLQLSYGAAPVGAVQTPDGSEVLISCQGNGMLLRYNATTMALIDDVELGPTPRAIAITEDGNRALVTRFISPEHTASVYDVDLSGALSLTRTISIERNRNDDGSASSRGVLNYLAGIRIAPNGDYAWVVGKKDNTTRGAFFSNNLQLTHDSTVRAQIVLINLSTNAEDPGFAMDIDNSESPTAIEFSDLGDYVFVTLQGNNQVAVIDLLKFMDPNSPGSINTLLQTGLAPQGLVIDDETNKIYTNNFMGRTSTVHNLTSFFENGSLSPSVTTIDTVDEERLHEEVLLGKQVFYNAFDPRMSAESYISCASCHVDGSHDGRTWDFTGRGEGFRNTTDLRGRSGMWHGNVHWSANFDEIQDFENDIRGGFGGEGFLTDEQFTSVSDTLGSPKAGLSTDLDALAAYVSSLGTESLPRSPHREANGDLSASALNGLALFNSNNCASCHTPSNDYTDRMTHDVGTLSELSGNRLGSELNGIDTPTLLGLHDAGPYLHNGLADSLREVFEIAGGTLVQGEDGTAIGNTNLTDVSWIPYKYWHNSMFAQLNDGSGLQFSNITTQTTGSGFVTIRYSLGYGNANATINVNGNTTNHVIAQTPNNPGWYPNEWRLVRIPVQYGQQNNTITISKTNGGDWKIDDVLFTTPDDLIAANAHVRGFSEQELDDLTAYLLSLDGNNAATPVSAVSRDADIPKDSIDLFPFPSDQTSMNLSYTIENDGDGPMNIGQVYLTNYSATKANGISIVAHPEPNLLPGESTTLELAVSNTAIGTTTTISAWTDGDVDDSNEISWLLEVLPEEDAAELVTVTLGEPSVLHTNTGPVTFPVTYANADTINLTASDINLTTTGDANATVVVNDGSTATPEIVLQNITGNGTLQIDIDSGTAVNADMVPSPGAGPSTIINVDNIAPTVSISPTTDRYTQGGEVLVFSVTYSGADSVNLSPANLNLIRTGTADARLNVVNGQTATPAISVVDITGEGSLRIFFQAGTASDLAGNEVGTPGTAFIYVDQTDPTFIISAPSPSSTSNSDVTYTVDYMEADQYNIDQNSFFISATGTADADVNVGSVINDSVTVTLTNISGDGEITLNAVAGTASDLAGNMASAGSSSIALEVDNTAPVVSLNDSATTQTSFGEVAFAYSTDNTNTQHPTIDDINLETTGSVTLDFRIETSSLSSGNIIAQNISGDGQFRIALAEGTFSDDLGNASNATSHTSWVMVDQTGPTLLVSEPSLSETANTDVNYMLSYTGEDAVTLDADDISLNSTGTANATVQVDTTKTSERTVTLTNISGDGEISISVAAGTAEDELGNQANAVASITSFVVDNTAPVVTLNDSLTQLTGNSPVSFEFSTDGTNTNLLDVNDVVLTADPTLMLDLSVEQTLLNQGTIIVDNFTGDGQFSIALATGSFMDSVGNVSDATTQTASVTVDQTAPVLTVSAPSITETSNNDVTYTLTYENIETVSLTTDDVTLIATGTVNAEVQVSSTKSVERFVTLTNISGDGELSISIAAGTAEDMVGNPANGVANTEAVLVDNTAPVVTLNDSNTPLTSTDPVQFAFTTDGTNNAFLDSSDVILVNDAGLTLDLRVEQTVLAEGMIIAENFSGDGDFIVSIAAEAFEDVLGNSSSATNQTATVTVDQTAPVVTLGDPSTIYTSNQIVTFAYTTDGSNVNGLSLNDVNLETSGTATLNLAINESANDSGLIEASSITGDGAFRIRIADAAFEDVSGNTSVATAYSSWVTVDNTAPVTEISNNFDETQIGQISLPVEVDDPASTVTLMWRRLHDDVFNELIVDPTLKANYDFVPASGDGVYEIMTYAIDAAGNSEDISGKSPVTIWFNDAVDSPFSQDISSAGMYPYPMDHERDILLEVTDISSTETVMISRSTSITNFPEITSDGPLASEALSLNGNFENFEGYIHWPVDPASLSSLEGTPDTVFIMSDGTQTNYPISITDDVISVGPINGDGDMFIGIMQEASVGNLWLSF